MFVCCVPRALFLLACFCCGLIDLVGFDCGFGLSFAVCFQGCVFVVCLFWLVVFV